MAYCDNFSAWEKPVFQQDCRQPNIELITASPTPTA